MGREEEGCALIVLGGGLIREGENYVLPKWVRERVESAKKIYLEKKGEIKCIIFSAGVSYRYGSTPPTIAEADLMKDYAFSLGLPSDNLLLEKDSRDTFSSAYYTRKMVDRYSIKKIIVVTSDFHLAKTKLLFDFVYGSDYYIIYVGVRHHDMDKEKVEKRKEWERAVIKHFKENVFPRLRKGDLKSIADYIFHESYSFTGKQENKGLEILREKIGDPLY